MSFRRHALPFLIHLAALGARGVRAQEALTLESAVQLALRQNRELARLAAEHERAWLDRAAAENEFALRIRPAAAVGAQQDAPTQQLGVDLLKRVEWGTDLEFGGAVLRSETPAGDATVRNSVHLQISQPLFRYAGRLLNREPIVRAASRIQASLRSLELKKSDVALQVIQTYTDIIRLEQQARLEQAALDRLDRLRRLTQARARQGRATQVDVLRVDSQVGEAESRARAAAERMAALRLDLAESLGLTPGVQLQLEPPPLPVEPPPPLETALAAAFENRLDLAQIMRDYQDVRRGLRIARRMLQPDLKLVARVDRFADGTTFSEAAGLEETGWSIGLRLDSDPIGGRERIAYRQAELDERTAGDDVETTRRLVERQVRQQLLQAGHAQAEIELARKNRAVADGRRRLAQRFFEMGRSDPFSVSDAEQQFQQAETAWLNAQYEAALAMFRLRRVTGSLVESPGELKPEPAADKSAQ